MIKSFRHKGLGELFENGQTHRVSQDLQSRCLRGLGALEQAEVLSFLNVPGFNFHGAFMEYPNATVSISMARGVSPLSGKRVMLCGSILNSIIEVNYGRIFH
jgi:plasmid maintenance system killer protein